MMKTCFLAFSAILLTGHMAAQDCQPSRKEVVIQVQADDYPNETSWELTDSEGALLASGDAAGDTICVDSASCLIFTIYDYFGDGICCGYGHGAYAVYLDGDLAGWGDEFGLSESVIFNCPPGYSCGQAVAVEEGDYTAPHPDYWYAFTPPVTGIYTVTTCSMDTCDTKLWIYSRCEDINASENNAGAVYYDDNDGGCGRQAEITAYLEASSSYLLRIGGAEGSCTGAIDWSISFGGEILGCLDSTSCNYNPMATVDDGSCLPPGDPGCGAGPDLMLLDSIFRTSLRGDVVNSSNICRIEEGCLSGFGLRQIIRFTTQFRNIGDLDYFIGNPEDQPGQFSYDNCHGHYHYEGYAEYRVYNDENEKISIGFKNGFCIADLECSGGGTPKFGCDNQGVTAGCGDYYSWVIPCQWVDVTDLPDGDYKIVNTINWDRSPDALGRHEQRYDNNWVQACITLTREEGVPQVTVREPCEAVIDCEGTAYGDVYEDCAGICGGSSLYGDVNGDFQQTNADAESYIFDIVHGGLQALPCYDLNTDGLISVYDAALVSDCYLHGSQHNHPGGGSIHDHCNLPGGVVNPMHSASLSIIAYDEENNTIDIGLSNPQDHIAGYEFDISGADILSVISLVDPQQYPAEPQFEAGGRKVVCLALNDSIIPKTDGSFQPLCRIQFEADSSGEVCIEEIVDLVNSDIHKISSQIMEGCVTVGMVSGIRNLAGHNLDIYPNPSTGLFSIRYKLARREEATVLLIDPLGRIIREHHLGMTSEGRRSADLSEEAPGIYSILFRTASGTSVRQVVKLD